MNNLVKLFQILTSGFGEDFLRISSCPYSAKSLHLHGSHVFPRIKIWRTIFGKGQPRNISVKYSRHSSRNRNNQISGYVQLILKSQLCPFFISYKIFVEVELGEIAIPDMSSFFFCQSSSFDLEIYLSNTVNDKQRQFVEA